MIDPVSAFALATAAYNAVKQGIEVGRELHEVSGALGKFFKASTDIKEAAEQQSKPSIFKKLLDKGSIEQEALDNLVRRRTIIKQEYELMMMVKMQYGDYAYNEMLEERRKISADRIKAERLQKEHNKKVVENIFMYSLLAILLYIFYWLIAAAYTLMQGA
jgi:hypothetical protein